jgi:hypothetical protein
MAKTIFERLQYIDSLPKEKDRINALQNIIGKDAIKSLLDYVFNSKLVFTLPEGVPPFTKLDRSISAHSRLDQEERKLYIFLKGNAPGLTNTRKEVLFVQILESVDPQDAILLCDIKDKKLPFKNITKKLVQKAFPTLIKE